MLWPQFRYLYVLLNLPDYYTVSHFFAVCFTSESISFLNLINIHIIGLIFYLTKSFVFNIGMINVVYVNEIIRAVCDSRAVKLWSIYL